MKRICLTIRNNPQIKIQATVGELDDLCEECPHKQADRCVQSEEIGKWGISQDKRVAKYLGIRSDSIQTAKDIFNISMEKADDDTINHICKGCIFLENCRKVGINNSFKKDLNRKLRLTCSPRTATFRQR